MKETNIATASLPQQCRPAVKELLKAQFENLGELVKSTIFVA